VAWSRLDLGVGIIAVDGVDQMWPDVEELIDVVEVEPQTLWDHRTDDGRRIGQPALDWLLSRDRPLLSHGVGFPVGGTVPPESDGVRASARSARALGAEHWSEHLSFNRAGPDPARHAGYLLPPIPTSDSVDAAVAHIARFQDQLDRPFLVETPTSYLRPEPGDLSDGQFVSQIAERADCGILLDLHNIWANELNGRQPVSEFLAELPLERVWEVHLAGGFYLDSYYLDAHVGGVSAELFEIAARVVPTLPHVRAILFEAVPESVHALGAAGVSAVLSQLHDLARLPATEQPADRRVAGAGGDVSDAGGAAVREAELLAYTTRASAEHPRADPGAAVLRHLTDHARLSLLVADFAPELKAMLTELGRTRTDELLEQFLACTPAHAWPREQGAAFAAWWQEQRASR
jgi:uncharacterized protein (UPF0276 family)